MDIYEKIVLSITNFTSHSTKKKNLTFLFCLMIGFLPAIFLLAEGVSWILSYYPLEVYSAFTGLIVASLPKLFKLTDKKNKSFFIIVAISIVFFIFFKITPGFSKTQSSLFLFFISGFLGFFSSVLPGLSGSTVLLILGTYHFILQSLLQGITIDLIIFLIGGILGLIGAFYCIHYFLKRRKNLFFCIILGFIIGSLPEILPWQKWPSTNIMNTIIKTISFILMGVAVFFLVEKSASLRKKQPQEENMIS